MKDEDKTKEQLLDELAEMRECLHEAQEACRRHREDVETLLSFKKALETMQLGVTITDLQGSIIYINPADLDMHGYSEEELKGGNISAIATAKDRKPLTEKDITSMKRWKRESVNKRKGGSTFPVQLMSDVIRDSRGRSVGIVTTCEDITDRKKMENEIRDRITELQKFYEASVQREVKMKELKKEISKLKDELSRYKDKAYTY